MFGNEDTQAARDRLTQTGMTAAEINVYEVLTRVAILASELPLLHPMEIEESTHILHDLGARLFERPGLRANLWPNPPRPVTKQDIDNVRENLKTLGMSEAELDAWYSLGSVAGLMVSQLPELYPMQSEETAHAFHRLQSRLLARPVIRAVKGHTPVLDSEVIPEPRITGNTPALIGLVGKEVEAWENLLSVASRVYALPSVYVGERREAQHDFDELELRLMARPAFRTIASD